MTDYISREAINQIIAAECGECADACLEFDGIMPDCNQCLLYGAKKAIDSIPAADVRPARRGKWNIVKLPPDHGYKAKECSACKCNFWDLEEWNFCPNCGARMEES